MKTVDKKLESIIREGVLNHKGSGIYKYLILAADVYSKKYQASKAEGVKYGQTFAQDYFDRFRHTTNDHKLLRENSVVYGTMQMIKFYKRNKKRI